MRTTLRFDLQSNAFGHFATPPCFSLYSHNLNASTPNGAPQSLRSSLVVGYFPSFGAPLRSIHYYIMYRRAAPKGATGALAQCDDTLGSATKVMYTDSRLWGTPRDA